MTPLERAARNAHDMTVADVRTVLAALVYALDEMIRHDRAIGPEFVTCIDRAELTVRKILQRHRVPGRPGRLPDEERRVTPTGRRLRVLARDYPEWADEGNDALAALLLMCENVLEASGVYPEGLAEARKHAADLARSSAWTARA